MKSLRLSSLQSWLWRKGSKQEEVEPGKQKVKERKNIEGTRTGLERAVGDSSSANTSASSQEALDWAIGWYERGICNDDGFAVLVPCYASPPQAQDAYNASSAPGSLSKSQLWADVFSKVDMETKTEALKRPPQ